MKLKNLLLAAALALPTVGQAHFQLIYTPQTQIERPGDVPLKLIFWHPFEAGHVMHMGPLEDLFVLHRSERTNLMETVRETAFEGPTNSAVAFDASVKVKRSGDYVLVATPTPYYEETEDKYIQQITKAFLNRNGLPTDWDAELGLKAEIVPLAKPYNIIAGSTFTGRVMADGKPVAGAEIEVEYIAAEPDMETGKAKQKTSSAMPGGALVIHSDDNGYFTFGIPRAGHWGFAALDIGPDTEFEGKELSQDAVIWIRAYGME